MPSLTFKAKPQKVFNGDDLTLAYEFVKLPVDLARYADKDAFRKHPEFRAYANSDMFGSILKRALLKHNIGPVIRLDRVPEGVSIDTSSFLTTVTIQVEGWR